MGLIECLRHHYLPRPCPDITTIGFIKTIVVVNIVGVVMCTCLLLTDIISRKGFQENDLILVVNSTEINDEEFRLKSQPESVLFGLTEEITTTIHYVLWGTIVLKDIIELLTTIGLFRTVYSNNPRKIIFCKFYLWATILVEFVFIFFMIDTTFLRINYPFTPSIFIVIIFHLLYKPFTVWIVLIYIKEITTYTLKHKNNGKNKRNLTTSEIQDFYKGITKPPCQNLGHENVAFQPDKFNGSKNTTSIDIWNQHEQHVNKFTQGTNENHCSQLLQDVNILPYNAALEISLQDLLIDEHDILGEGEYGAVYRGLLRKQSTDDIKAVAVAVKTTKYFGPELDVEYFKVLLGEVKILCSIGQNENIVSLIGVCTSEIQHRQIWLALELCDGGTLEKYLRNKRTIFKSQINEVNGVWLQSTVFSSSHYVQVAEPVESFRTIDLIQWGVQIAAGMEFLARKHVVHGDLATRNILLTSDRTIKISDFGLSRKLYNYFMYAQNNDVIALPWQWMSIESLTHLTFSIQSDVWSFGVVMWELFTLGQIPYNNFEWNENFVTYLKNGNRLQKPRYSSMELYHTMRNCWNLNPHERPNFNTLYSIHSKILEKAKNMGF